MDLKQFCQIERTECVLLIGVNTGTNGGELSSLLLTKLIEI